ncbi:uncharacterized protein LOC123270820 [Cotesia glomerata]|uniref:uncharacterized protein LOC123270820 n=1 Tax=Cotesia glomerata TaxID=32391 RepID=UPI001D024B0F|nr:uncharacterized protein LOC123270820 [Cotesia glomerata]
MADKLFMEKKTIGYKIRLISLFEFDEKPLSKYAVITMFRIFNWVVVTLIVVANAADFCININDFLEVAYNLNYMVPFLMTELKSMAIYFQRSAFRRLIDDIHEPISFLKHSSVRGAFPLNETQSPTFELILGTQCYGLFIACVWTVVFDTTLLGFIRWLNVQLVILQANFRHCNDITTSRASLSVSQQNYNIIQAYQFLKVPEEQKEIRSFVPFTLKEANIETDSFILRFRTCVINHRRLIDNLKNCNDFFQLVMFGQIVSSVLLVCVGLFVLVMVSISSTQKKVNCYK